MLKLLVILMCSVTLAHAAAAYQGTIKDFHGFSHGALFIDQGGHIFQQTEYYSWMYTWMFESFVIYTSNGRLLLKAEHIDHAVEIEIVR